MWQYFYLPWTRTDKFNNGQAQREEREREREREREKKKGDRKVQRAFARRETSSQSRKGRKAERKEALIYWYYLRKSATIDWPPLFAVSRSMAANDPASVTAGCSLMASHWFLIWFTVINAASFLRPVCTHLQKVTVSSFLQRIRPVKRGKCLAGPGHVHGGRADTLESLWSSALHCIVTRKHERCGWK